MAISSREKVENPEFLRDEWLGQLSNLVKDVASLYLVEGRWRLHYVYPEAIATSKVVETIPLTQESLDQALNDMCAHAA